MKYIVKAIVCDYEVIKTGNTKPICICNIKRNAELIADILNGDNDNSCAYSYDVYPNAKYKVVKALEQEPKTEWISVSERLPEKNVEVLVTTEWNCITIGEMFSNNDWFIHEGATTTNIDDIKAWMPLPEPYKESEDE